MVFALVNDVGAQDFRDADVGEMTFGIDDQLADLPRHITLLPGNIILTGTPANAPPMQPGD